MEVRSWDHFKKQICPSPPCYGPRKNGLLLTSREPAEPGKWCKTRLFSWHIHGSACGLSCNHHGNRLSYPGPGSFPSPLKAGIIQVGGKRKWEQFQKVDMRRKQDPGHPPVCFSPNLFPTPCCSSTEGWGPGLATLGWFKVTVGALFAAACTAPPPWTDPVTAPAQFPTQGTEKWLRTPDRKGLFILAVSLKYTQNSKQLWKHLDLLNFSLLGFSPK